MAYPVSPVVEPSPAERTRFTVALRPLLAIPHALIIGPLWFRSVGFGGLLGAVAALLSVVNWFAIVVAGRDLEGVRQLQLYYLRWRLRGLAYMALLVDTYPPFGDGPYPATVDVVAPVGRDRTSVAFRLPLLMPHFIVLCVLMLGCALAVVVAWFAILATGRFPTGLESFCRGCLYWLVRFEAYMLLLTDEYPPFSLS